MSGRLANPKGHSSLLRILELSKCQEDLVNYLDRICKDPSQASWAPWGLGQNSSHKPSINYIWTGNLGEKDLKSDLLFCGENKEIIADLPLPSQITQLKTVERHHVYNQWKWSDHWKRRINLIELIIWLEKNYFGISIWYFCCIYWSSWLNIFQHTLSCRLQWYYACLKLFLLCVTIDISA